MSASGPQKDRIQPRHRATVENTGTVPLAIGVTVADARLEMELAAGQIVELTTGEAGGEVILHRGDPAALLVVKPDTP